MANVTLRPEREEDEGFVYRVYASTRIEELSVTDWTPETKEAFLRMQFAAQVSHYRNHYAESDFSIVEVDGVAAGRIYVGRWPEEIRIIDIALLPDYRRRGIGSKLINEVLAEAEEAGKPVTIHVEKFNPARRLYARLGFRQIQDKGVYLLLCWSPDSCSKP